MDQTKIHIRTPVGEVLVSKADLDPAKWMHFERTGLRQYVLWEHPETGASIALLDFPEGSGVPDRHTHASNQFMYCIDGEYEYVDSKIVLRPGDFYMNPKDNPHGPTVARKRSFLLEVYDGPHYYEQPSYHTKDTVGKVVDRATGKVVR
jgi:quercetin dioxygenase-like cupin family protein